MKSVPDLFKSFESQTVLIIGDVMVDSYMWGKVSRISPEAPVPVVAVDKKENRLGGAANVALNIKALGAKPILCSITGDDFHGSIFRDLLKKEGMPADGILAFSERHTTVKTRIISQAHQMLRVDEELEEPINSDQEKQLLRKIKELIESSKPSVIIFEDYDKGAITPFVISETVKLASEKGIPVTADPKKKNFHHYQNISLFKPNLKELNEGLKSDVEASDIADINELVKKFKANQKISSVLLTLSEHGVLICSNGSCEHIPAHKRIIADVSGAGDTVISVASLCLAAGLKPTHIALLSNLAGGQVCEKVGVVPVDREQLKAEINALNISF